MADKHCGPDWCMTIWSEQEDRTIQASSMRGTMLEAEQALGEFWNSSPGVTADFGRYRAFLMRWGSTVVVMTIG
jgi:hypothetical protein